MKALEVSNVAAQQELLRISWRLACNSYGGAESQRSLVGDDEKMLVGTPTLKPSSLRTQSSTSMKTEMEDSDLRKFHEEFVDQFLTYCPDLKHAYPIGYLIIAKMIISFISSMVNEKQMEPMIARFARSHVKYDLDQNHFNGFGHALVLTIQKRLGKIATVGLVQIWSKVMRNLVGCMW
eukprot:CAMPEP_0170183718 /NCGR_PEP_ID=MMETSP0040_2-20121228/31492_1 /TAXON_ID=641309 /ORGANISM="Lotharella oceanica, Strain CCMP622" /LENGTH=178 /DNA_ID=CAMNT_0010429541 /DNA_START=20 /DNA_END=553 /DNA_ORIENTATION=+